MFSIIALAVAVNNYIFLRTEMSLAKVAKSFESSLHREKVFWKDHWMKFKKSNTMIHQAIFLVILFGSYATIT